MHHDGDRGRDSERSRRDGENEADHRASCQLLPNKVTSVTFLLQ